jgi:hypothetical protein
MPKKAKRSRNNKKKSSILLYSLYFNATLALIGILLIYIDQFRIGIWFLVASIGAMVSGLFLWLVSDASMAASRVQQWGTLPTLGKWFVGITAIMLLLVLFITVLKTITPWCY